MKAAKLLSTKKKYARREGDEPIGAVGRLGSNFIRNMPEAFFDPLPVIISKKRLGPPLTKVRDVTFDDVSPLLLGSVTLDRRSLTMRFSPRLSDPAFRQAITQRFGGTLDWEPELYRFERKSSQR